MDGWESVRLPTYEKTTFHPEVSATFRGVKIWTPPKVSPQPNARRVPIFGVVRLDESAFADLGITDRHPLRAVVVGVVTGPHTTPYVGAAVQQAPLFPVPPGPTVTEYFAIDLLEQTGVSGPGTYFVFASVGQHTAGPLRVEVTS